MFAKDFASAKMVCVAENIFEDGPCAILEWRDPLGLRGCGFFSADNDKIVFRLVDQLSFLSCPPAEPTTAYESLFSNSLHAENFVWASY